MNRKILTLTECRMCVYCINMSTGGYTKFVCSHPDIIKKEKIIKTPVSKIPDWCPLPDAPEELEYTDEWKRKHGD